ADLAKIRELDRSGRHHDLARGLTALAGGEPEKAREIFETMSHSSRRGTLYDSHFALALYHRLISKNRTEEIAELTKSLEMRPRGSQRLDRADAYYYAKAFADAIADVNEYLKHNSRGSTRAFAIRADALRDGMGRHLEAIEDYDRIERLAPGDADNL